MNGNKRNKLLLSIVIILIMVVVPRIPEIVESVKSISGGHDIENVRSKMKKALYEKYGEEFVVDRIGTRSSRGEEFYQARIYPKSIVGTNKQGDEYYYASASVEKKSFGNLGGVGDGYSVVQMNLGAEEYLLPKAEEIFGERILLKIDVEYKKRESKDFFGRRLESNFRKVLSKTINDPENNRIELELDIYIFDRIDSEKEKEKRRKDIFKFIQYLKEEELFEYLEMRVLFTDERVLAPSYDEFETKIKCSDKVKVEIEEDTTVKLPPEKLRREMSKVLQKEINGMSKEEMLGSMKEIKKDELNYDGIEKHNVIYFSRIYSPGILKERYPTSLKQNSELKKGYNKINDVKIPINLEYIYTD